MSISREPLCARFAPGLALAFALLTPLSAMAQAATITRGPYLQRPTPDGIVVRWRTDVATDSRVLCGPAPGNLVVCADDSTSTTEHEVPLFGLSADTRYYYAIGTTAEVLAGDDAVHFFYSSPVPSTPRALRIWAMGDFGTGNANAIGVRDAYYAYTAGTHTDLWLMLGDNAYQSGSDEDYQLKVFEIYHELLRQTVAWPTLGNHDSNSSSAAQSGPFFDIFSLPAGGESGGLPSNTEAYYSFDHANAHFVVLNSFDVPRGPGSAMLLWLSADLASTTQDWIIAFWHHPPYSKGGHDSDVEGPLIDMRQNALPILEDHGVDLVLTGHSHSYERSYLIDSHYGASDQIGICDDAGTPGDTSDDFCAGDPGTPCPSGIADCDSSGFLVDAGDGRQAGDGPYGKPLLGPDPHRGAVYAVAGTGGQNPTGGSLDHPVMFISLNVLGSLVLDLAGERLDATFIDESGAALDTFSIVKGLDCPSGPYLDDDADGVCNDLDNCPADANPDQADADADGLGDACDACPDDADNDIDADGVCGEVDNCPDEPNTDQLDGDADGAGDICDVCPADAANDIDGDGFCADVDNCPIIANSGQIDSDTDGAGDACDPCPMDPLDDADLDGLCADADNCPLTFNPCQLDADGDGTGNVCDVSEPGSCNAFVVADGWLDEDSPTHGHSSSTTLRSRNEPGDDRRPVLRFDLSAVPAETTVATATGWFYVLDADDRGQPVNLHRITDDWTEFQVNWNNTAADFDVTAAASFAPADPQAWTAVDLSGLVQAWIDGTHPNQGVMLQSTSGSDDSTYASKERFGGAQRACLDIVFQCLSPDHDTDGDGTPDASDGCPNDPAKIEPGLCGCHELDTDSDGDGSADCDDNCPAIVNADQADADADAAGDVCDSCPLDPENDIDGDTVCADADSCPLTPNPNQADADLDGLGDACDGCPLDQDNDLDGDGECGNLDNCPATFNPQQADSDMDGIGDACQAPDDADGDGVPDAGDNCPLDPNPVQRDADIDGLGDACDPDDDGDGVLDGLDCAPLSPAVTEAAGEVGATLSLGRSPGGTELSWLRGTQGHVSHVYRGMLVPGSVWHGGLDCVEFANPGMSTTRVETPASGVLFYFVASAANICGESSLGQGSLGTPRSATGGCPLGSEDTDGDAVPDGEDNCPAVVNAGLSDVDSDFVGDVCDNCPGVPNPSQADDDGDGIGDACENLADGDGDGIGDSSDNCPDDFNTTQDDADGDGIGDVCDPCVSDPGNDADADGLCAAIDNCPADSNPSQLDTDGDGEGDACDTDDDNDGVADVADADPLNQNVCGDVDGDTCDDCSLVGLITILETGFDADGDGFSYADDTFRDTSEPGYASGQWVSTGGFAGGGLTVELGGIDFWPISGMSGGWAQSFLLPVSSPVTLSVRYNLTQSPYYESSEFSQALVSVDGLLHGEPPDDYVAQVAGDGNGGSEVTTGWQTFEVDLGVLGAGSHTLIVGAFNSHKSDLFEVTEIAVDDLLVVADGPDGFDPDNDGPDADGDGLCDAGDPD